VSGSQSHHLNNPAGDDENRFFRNFSRIIFLQELAVTQGFLSLWAKKIEIPSNGGGQVAPHHTGILLSNPGV
jgi:hypothetical protein